MIDFKNGKVFKLSPADNTSNVQAIMPLLVNGEQVIAQFAAIRDFVIYYMFVQEHQLFVGNNDSEKRYAFAVATNAVKDFANGIPRQKIYKTNTHL